MVLTSCEKRGAGERICSTSWPGVDFADPDRRSADHNHTGGHVRYLTMMICSDESQFRAMTPEAGWLRWASTLPFRRK